MDEISENTWNEELNELFLVNIQFREFFLDWVQHVDPKITTKKFRMHQLSHNESLNLKDYSYWKIFNVQIRLSVREYIRVVNWRWRIVFARIATLEVAKKLKNWERSCYREENTARQQDCKNFLCKMIRNHAQRVCWAKSRTKITRTILTDWRFENLLWSWLTEQLWQYLLSTSSP